MTVVYVSLGMIVAALVVFLINAAEEYGKPEITVITEVPTPYKPPTVVFGDNSRRYGTRDIIVPKREVFPEPDPPPLKVA